MSEREFNIKNFGSQPGQSTLARVAGMARGFAFNTVLMGTALVLANKVLPHDWKPTVLIGQFIADLENNDINTKADTVVQFTRRTTIPQADAQIEVEVNKNQQEILRESLRAKSDMAVAADWGCAIGSIVPAQAWGDWSPLAALLRSGCDAGDRLRGDVLEAQRRAARSGTAIEPREVITPPQAQPPPEPRAVRTPPPETAPAPPEPHITILRVKPVHL